MYYILERNELASEIHRRWQVGTELKERINGWVASMWGISNFYGMVNQHFPVENGVTYGVLCRQLATARVEEAAFRMTALNLGMEPMNLTFEGDIFVADSHDKRHLIKVPWIKGHGNGGPIIQYRKITNFPANGTLLRNIQVGQESLPGYHRRLRQMVFGNNQIQFDSSNLLSALLCAAERKPKYVYENGKKKETEKADLACSRPPAEWYYPLYLSWFLAGNMVLFETYDNPEGNVGPVKRHFCRTMDLIKQEIGLYPLVAKILPLKLPMMCMNEALIGTTWQQQIIPSTKNSIPGIFEDFACQIISLGKTN